MNKELGRRMKKIWKLLKGSLTECSDGDTTRLGAALAYYTIFAIAPLLLILVTIAGFFFGTETARQQLFNEVDKVVGHTGGTAVQAMVTAAARSTQAGIWASIAAVVTFILGATAALVELRNDLNTIWKVKRPEGHGLKYIIKDYVLSIVVIVAIGVLLMASLLLDTVIAAVGHVATGLFHNHQFVVNALNFFVSLGFITVLFAMIFKWLPDIRLRWGDVWVGAALTALLFNVGKLLIGYYLGHSSTLSIYGAAGSLVLVVMWVYYSAQIVFFGAAFTKVYAAQRAEARGETKTSPPAPPPPAHNGHDGEAHDGVHDVEPRFSFLPKRKKE